MPRGDFEPGYRRGSGLVEVLDRVLDKGLVIAGDVRISLADVELLTIRIRLLVCSIDKAQEIGLDWWKHDPYLHGAFDKHEEIEQLRAQVAALETRLARRKPRKLSARSRNGAGATAKRSR